MLILLLCLFFVTLQAQQQEADSQESFADQITSDYIPQPIEQFSENVPSGIRLVADKIVATVFGQEDIEIITQSDLQRPSLAGVQRTLHELEQESLLYLEAKRMNMAGDDESVDSYIQEIKKKQGWGDAQVEQLFMQGGYLLQEGRQQLKKMQATNNILDFKVRSNIRVPRAQIEAYYKQNPPIAPAEYQLRRAVIPFDASKDLEYQRGAVQEYITTGKRAARIRWGEPFWILHEDVAPDKQWIYTLAVGQKKVIEENNSFVIFELLDKKDAAIIPLEECYQQIAEQLRKPRFEELMDTYINELFENATIVHH